LFHQLGRFPDALVLETVKDVRRHHVLDSNRLGIASFRDGTDNDVPIRNHAHQAILLAADGQRPDVQIPHHPRRFLQSRVGMRTFGTGSHDFMHLHSCSPFFVTFFPNEGDIVATSYGFSPNGPSWSEWAKFS